MHLTILNAPGFAACAFVILWLFLSSPSSAAAADYSSHQIQEHNIIERATRLDKSLNVQQRLRMPLSAPCSREHAGTLEGAAAAQSVAADEQARTTQERTSTRAPSTTRSNACGVRCVSCSMEVKIVQITKQRAQDKQDLRGLNIALDSKLQELELLKRRIGVRGTCGATPA
ncbi:hypothetical protein B0H11DRAFT_2266606 [Mycena galericulata]|nr:hypothetical protein B0H11DRAFT_2266606 [Mycena galericulata]